MAPVSARRVAHARDVERGERWGLDVSAHMFYQLRRFFLKENSKQIFIEILEDQIL